MSRQLGNARRLRWAEILALVAIAGLLGLSLLPDIIDTGHRPHARVLADAQQLMRHYTWLTLYKERYGAYPNGGGHEFILEPWVRGIVERTPVNLAMYFVPEVRCEDDHFLELRRKPMDEIWKDLAATTSADTHYAGRARQYRERMDSASEAWMADDNEGRWCHAEGTINVLMGDGRVLTLGIEDELRPYGAVLQRPFEVGPRSPHPVLQKLEK